MINVRICFYTTGGEFNEKEKKTREEKNFKQKTSASSSSLLLFIFVVVRSVNRIRLVVFDLLLVVDITFVFAFLIIS